MDISTRLSKRLCSGYVLVLGNIPIVVSYLGSILEELCSLKYSFAGNYAEF